LDEYQCARQNIDGAHILLEFLYFLLPFV